MEEVTMRRCRLAGLIIPVVAGAAMVACSGQSPVGSEAVEAPRSVVQALPGTYTLSFVSGGQTVTSLPVGSEVGLKAEVTDAFGAPAQNGSVTFEYCSFKGLPPNDITRADEAPKEACESGEADWARLTGVRVTASGVPLVGFGVVQIPRTVGFRIQYTGGQAIGIASGSASANFTWCPLSGCQ
jgi:hypothetical protein